MKELATWAAILALTAWSASAGSLDRSGQPVDILFEPGGETGSYLELSYATTTADVSGTGVGRDFDAPLAFLGSIRAAAIPASETTCGKPEPGSSTA